MVAFEPSAKSFAMLKRGAILSHSSRIRSYRIAVGDVDGIIDFEINRKSNLSRIVVDPLGRLVEKASECKIGTFVSESDLSDVHFIRMEIEGYEYRALVGAKETMRRWKPEIVVGCTVS